MTEQLRKLGPLNLPKVFAEWDRELEPLAHRVQQQKEAAHA